VYEVIERAGPAGRNHRNRHGRGNRSIHRAVEADLCTVTVDRGQENFPSAALLRLACPLDGIAVGSGLTAPRLHPKPVVLSFWVNCDHDRLASVAPCEGRNQGGVRERRSIQADFIGSGVNRGGGVVFGPDAAADRERDEQLPGDTADRLSKCTAALERRGHVENDQLVNAFYVVATGESGRFAGAAQAFEVHALYDLTVANVEAGDDPFR